MLLLQLLLAKVPIKMHKKTNQMVNLNLNHIFIFFIYPVLITVFSLKKSTHQIMVIFLIFYFSICIIHLQSNFSLRFYYTFMPYMFLAYHNFDMKFSIIHFYSAFYDIFYMNNQSLDNYQRIKVIGKGTYAKVFLVINKLDNKVYALKVLKKKYILEKDQKDHIMTEKTILSNVQHPFLVQLKASFQDKEKLYFVLQYCPGGQLFGLLALKDVLNQEQTKFYAAQILLALEMLHHRGVIYRDLKPENVLLDRQGYLKLTDFGLSKLLKTEDDMAMSVCGTPQYLAPQILQKKGHQFTVDWWCLGCIIYQMITGFPPFRNKNRMQLFQAILNKPFPLPSTLSPKLQNLLSRLLQKDPNSRLGAKGAAEIKQHPWFEKVNWDVLLKKSIKAPFVPILDSQIDTSNFDEEFTNCPLDSLPEKNSMQQQSLQNGKFVGFSYQKPM